MDQQILIGGAPTAGKSHLAKRLAKELELPWISTDTIREMMRKIVSTEKFPHLMLYPLHRRTIFCRISHWPSRAASNY